MKTFRYLENTAILKLDQAVCIGCGVCVTVCPHRVLAMGAGDKAEIVDHGGCMECGACACNCPVNAIFVNQAEGCGCAALIIGSWISRFTGRKIPGCNC